MPRKFPKFIFQNVTNAKSRGEYIMHLMYPAMLMQVRKLGQQVMIELVHCYENKVTDRDMSPILEAAKQWYLATCNPMPITHTFSHGVPIKIAYNKLMGTRGIYKTLEIDRSTVSIIRDKIVKKGKYPSHEHMVTDLLRAGWHVSQNELWEPKVN